MDAKRPINKDKYIDLSWLCEQVPNHNNCSLCGYKYYYFLEERNYIRCNLSVDRLDDTIGHEKDNCHLLCVECNKCKK